MFHKQIGSNRPRQLHSNSKFLPTSNNERIINYTSQIFSFLLIRIFLNFVPTPTRPGQPLVFWVTMCTSGENRASLPVEVGWKEEEMEEEAGKEGWNTRRVPLPSWATRNPSFSSSTSNFVSSIGPLIVLLGNEHPSHNCIVMLFLFIMSQSAVVDS